MTIPPIVFVHGVATTGSIWSRVRAHLRDMQTSVIERPCSGDLATELAALTPSARGALVVGVSGGATLGLALASSPVPMAGALLHEPAVGRLAPALLAPMAEAFAEGGTALFAHTLYGPSWDPSMATGDEAAVGRELPMFRAFEPHEPSPGQGPVLVTVGADSPSARHKAVRALSELGYSIRTVYGAGHFAHWDSAKTFAALVRETAEALQ